VLADPASFEAHLRLGAVLSREGRLEEARRSLDKALALRPGLVPALAERAHLELRFGDPAEAARLYRRCVERGREDLRPLLERAEAKAARGLGGG
jgi:Flp pilus assembly protein TadD